MPIPLLFLQLVFRQCLNASFSLATVNNAQLQQLSIANYSEKVVAVTEIVQLPVNSSNYD